MALEMALCVMMVLEFAGKCSELGFPGGSVGKNPPADGGDAGSIPGPGRSDMRGAAKPVRHND